MTHCKPAKRGLTLIELLVVVAVLGLVTATVTVRLGDTLGPAALAQAIAQWKFTDQELRVRARETGGETQLQLELGTNRLACVWKSEAPPTVRTLGRSVCVTKYVSTTQEENTGALSIRYDGRGASETFAVEFTGPRQVRRWLVVAGFTGQISEVQDEAHVRELLQALAPQGVYASGSRGESPAVGDAPGGPARGASPAHAADSCGRIALGGDRGGRPVAAKLADGPRLGFAETCRAF